MSRFYDFSHRHGNFAPTTVADGRLQTVADGCGRLRTVADARSRVFIASFIKCASTIMRSAVICKCTQLDFNYQHNEKS